MTRIMSCACKHEFQDRIYASGNRTKRDEWRCTVCSAKKEGRK